MSTAIAIITGLGGLALGIFNFIKAQRRDRDQLHKDLRPTFTVTCVADVTRADDAYATVTRGERATLVVKLTGPPELAKLDEVAIRIRDDRPGRADAAVLGGGRTPDEIRSVIWGPYRFVPGVNGADQVGRNMPAVELALDEEHPFALERSMTPQWVTNRDSWRTDYDNAPFRLEITARSGKHTWITPVQVPVTLG